ncbi:Huntingtin-interacting protein 1-related protein [Heterocephalus glaber]|uniref:Huntingtin-interacting protein 1-related protein n=1 Tax=Heterocephalus glaber TaxID=10181 RepID=G5AWR7_HETGA|nr:Huntingtin-interacting protein 1-related protein [Heterocephalus glaber]
MFAQAISISKAINSQEAPVKEKHARRIILGTHHEKGAFTFWSYAIGLPLPSSSILSWKFCHVLHKVLRDGHANVLHDCQRYRSNIREIGDLWGHLHDRYGQLVNVYTKLLLTKISFHLKHPQFPAGLEVTDEVLEKAAGTDVNNIFQLTVEMFDYMDCELKLSESVFRQLNTAIAVSQMSSGQCRLAPLIQVIQDCSHLYHYTVKLLFKLHSCLPADTLQGHRDRFHEQFHSLRNFFRRASDMIYFKRLIQIPRLPESPPNFLRASALAEHIKPVVVIPEEAPEDEEPENLIEISTGPPAGEPVVVADLLDQTFGPPNGSMKADRDLQVESLKREVELLRAELEKTKLEARRYVAQLKGQVNALEAELEEQRTQKQKALVDNEQLRHELTQLRAVQQEGLTVTQQSQEEVARGKEQLAFQMEQVKRESEMKLEEQSDQLERLKRELEAKAGELAHMQEALSRAEQSGSELSSRLDALSAEKDVLSITMRQQEAELLAAQDLAREKEVVLSQEQQRSSRERTELQGQLAEKESQEQGLQQRLLDEQFAMVRGTATEARAILQDAVSLLDDPLHLRCTSSPAYLVSRAQVALDSVSALEKGHAQYLASPEDASALVAALTRFSHLAADAIINGGATSHLAPTDPADRLMDACRECGARALELTGQLSLRLLAAGKASATEARYSRLKEKHGELVSTHATLLRKVGALATPAPLARLQSLSPPVKEQLAFQMEQVKRESEMKSGSELSSRLDALSAEKDVLSITMRQQEAELLAAQDLAREKEVVLSQEQQRSSRERTELQGQLAEKESQEQGLQQRLLDEQFAMVRGTATEARAILQDAELKPKSLDVRQEELGAMVDKEMAATSAAIEDAVRRIEDPQLLHRTDEGEWAPGPGRAPSGPPESHTHLGLQAIRLLVTTSTSLQKEIVDSGRTPNSRWTEGLISASKAVGWGASQLVESADRVVLHTGNDEDLFVCCHEIAGSTAQLVAASKVKADKHSPCLSRLQECSRAVNERAAGVVASTKSGQEQIEDRDTMDFSGLSLIKLKKQEMETQVRVLELEKTLEAERVRLGELRKQHYVLAGGVGTPEEEPSRPTMAPRGATKKPPLAQKPIVAPRQDPQLDGKDGTGPTQLVSS